MSPIRFFAVFILTLCFGCSFADESEWKYVSPASAEHMGTIRISTDRHTITYNEHVGRYWEDCDPGKTDYTVCFESPQLFMKLLHSALESDGWEEDGVSYSLHFHRDVQLFGQAMGDIYVVVLQGPEKRSFIYSTDRGIIAIGFGQTDLDGVAMIIGNCGYGAPSKCYEESQVQP